MNKIILIFLILFSPSVMADGIAVENMQLSGGVLLRSYNIAVLPIGDSITYGTANGSFGYRARLQTSLGSNYKFVGSYRNPNSDQYFSVYHEGLQVNQPTTSFSTGYTASMNTRGQASALKFFPGANQKIILFHGGTNNVKQESGGFMDEATTVNDIADSPLTTASFVGWVVNNFPDAKIYIALIIPSPNAANDSAFTSFNTALNTRLTALLATYTNLHIVDMNSAFRANASWATDYMADTLHPTGTGYDIMADTWYSCIQSSLNTYCDGH